MIRRFPSFALRALLPALTLAVLGAIESLLCARVADGLGDHGFCWLHLRMGRGRAPAVQQAACIGVYHPKWDERPLLVVVPKAGEKPTAAAILDFLKDRVVRWWLPDDVVFVDELPHTATGKLLKTKLREQYRDHRLPTA